MTRTTRNLLITLASVILISPALAYAQKHERLVDKESWRYEPIKILKLKTRDKPIELGKKFEEDDDWLYALTVTVKNVSDKAIARVEYTLRFPRSGPSSSPEQAQYAIAMAYGKDPAEVTPQEVLKLLQPGEDIDVKLLEVNVPVILEDLEKLGYERPFRHARLILRSVTFVDGSEWNGNEILYPDPTNPKRKINPKLPLDLLPKNPKHLPDQSKIAPEPCIFHLPKVELRAHAPLLLKRDRAFGGKFLPAQLPETLPCDRIFLKQESRTCGPPADACKYLEDIFAPNPTPENMWQLNSRAVFDQRRCLKSDLTPSCRLIKFG